jgi:hypothetical protein
LQAVDAETIRSWPFLAPDFVTHALMVVEEGPLIAQAPPPRARNTAIVDITFA